MKKIIRSITYFADTPVVTLIRRCQALKKRLEEAGFEVQTMRFCCRKMTIKSLAADWNVPDFFWSVGTLTTAQLKAQLDDFFQLKYPIFYHLEPEQRPEPMDIELWQQIAKHRPEQTFHSCYVFNNAWNSPFFPSARSQRRGFSIGLQAADLAEGCVLPEQWKNRMQLVWDEIEELMRGESDFLGVDTSIASMGDGAGSIMGHIEGWFGSMENALLSDFFCRTSEFIKTQSPHPTGICGWFFPCLEDATLARLYEQGHFSTERNLFLSLHSGTGIDTYPVGIDQRPERLLTVLQLVKALSDKYNKTLTVRWITDGKTAIGQRTQFNNQYLQEVTVREI